MWYYNGKSKNALKSKKGMPIFIKVNRKSSDKVRKTGGRENEI